MKPVLFLRIASVLTLIHAALHTIGGVFGAIPPGPAQVAVSAMKANEFALMGAMRTYWDFYMGFGLAISVFLIVEGVVFWQLGSLARIDASRLKPILLTFFAGYSGFAVVSYRYFFAAPVVTEKLIAVCLGLAIASSKPVSAEHADRPAVS